MPTILRAAGGALCLALIAAAPAFATENVHAGLSPAAQHALSLTTSATLTQRREFTIIPNSVAPADLTILETYFAAFGFAYRETPNLKHVILTGNLAMAAAAAHLSYQSFVSHGETIVRATPVAFPPAIARLVKATSFIPGAHAHPLSVRPAVTVNGPANGYGPAEIAGLYDINPVYNAGITGASQTVAVAACSSIAPSDLTAYDALFGLPPAKLTIVPIDGTTTAQDGEAILDVERVHGTAPGAAIRLYLAPNCAFNEIVDVFARIAEDTATYHFAAVSHSYGFNEGDFGADGLGQSLLDQSAALAEIAAHHTPVFVSSGDGGSWNDLGIENATDVSFPASDPSVIAVGGTTVEAGTVGTRLFEHGWTGSGGGVSGVFTIPAFQVGTPGFASGAYRNLPDVAMLADPYTGVTEVFALGGGTFPIGGTSVSAPTFAGMWTLAADARKAAGRPPVSNVVGAMYGHRSIFYDVTAGSNGFYVAGPGADNVTGLGVPDVAKLVNAAK